MPGLYDDLNWVRLNRTRAKNDYLLSLSEDREASKSRREQSDRFEAALELQRKLAHEALSLANRVNENHLPLGQEKQSISGLSQVRMRQVWIEDIQTCTCAELPDTVFHVSDASGSGITRFTLLAIATFPHAVLRVYHPIGYPSWRGSVAITRCESANLEPSPAVDIVVLANNRDVLELIKELNSNVSPRVKTNKERKTLLYLHDLNLVYMIRELLGPIDFVDDYGFGPPHSFGHLGLIMGFSGVRTLMRILPADAILTHSELGNELLGEELDDYAELRFFQVSHPALGRRQFGDCHGSRNFSDCCPGVPSVLEGGKRWVAHFGIPFDWKLPDVTHEAFAELRNRGLVDGLLFAGFSASKVLPDWISRAPDVQVLDDVCERCMIELMRGVELAIQPRNVLAGEASGVLAELSDLGTPVVASVSLTQQTDPTVVVVPVAPFVEELLEAAIALLVKIAHADLRHRSGAIDSVPEHSLGSYHSALRQVLIEVGARE